MEYFGQNAGSGKEQPHGTDSRIRYPTEKAGYLYSKALKTSF